jgi:hypothetical protein
MNRIEEAEEEEDPTLKITGEKNEFVCIVYLLIDVARLFCITVFSFSICI